MVEQKSKANWLSKFAWKILDGRICGIGAYPSYDNPKMVYIDVETLEGEIYRVVVVGIKKMGKERGENGDSHA